MAPTTGLKTAYVLGAPEDPGTLYLKNSPTVSEKKQQEFLSDWCDNKKATLMSRYTNQSSPLRRDITSLMFSSSRVLKTPYCFRGLKL